MMTNVGAFFFGYVPNVFSWCSNQVPKIVPRGECTMFQNYWWWGQSNGSFKKKSNTKLWGHPSH
jgi:hypothetical protein